LQGVRKGGNSKNGSDRFVEKTKRVGDWTGEAQNT